MAMMPRKRTSVPERLERVDLLTIVLLLIALFQLGAILGMVSAMSDFSTRAAAIHKKQGDLVERIEFISDMVSGNEAPLNRATGGK